MGVKISAGLLMYRIKNNELEVFLAFPGGPYFKNKDKGFWTIPKGEREPCENMLDAAIREFKEETGITPQGDFISLGQVVQKGGKMVYAWAFQGDWDSSQSLTSNLFEIEWPPGSGKKQKFPEIVKGSFFPISQAREKINPAQREFLDRLETALQGQSL